MDSPDLSEKFKQAEFFESFKPLSWKMFERVKGHHIKELRRLMPDPGKKLFVACGYGYDVGFFDGVGVDIAFNCIKHLNKAVQGDAQHLPFKPESFDYVITNSFHHLFFDFKGCFEEMWRVLKWKGRLIMTEPHKYSLYNYIYNTVFRLWKIEKGMLRLTPGKLIAMFEDAYLTDISYFHKGIDPLPNLRGIWANFYITGVK